MHYDFPVIRHLSDVLPAIAGRDEFVVAERDWGTVVNYVVAMADTFPPVVDRDSAIRRECRGLMFDRDGNIMARRLHKFFNVNERDETQEGSIDLGRHHVILEKLDGSMITPVLVDGYLRFGTKMGINDISMQAEAFVAVRPELYHFCAQSMQSSWTPIFEWCSRKQKIVIDHPEDRLVLIAMRDTITGQYMQYDQMYALAWRICEVVRQFEGTVENMRRLVEHTHALEGTEGFIVRFDDGHMVKVKSDWYVTRHRAKDSISQEKNVISMIVDGEVDDVKAMLPDEDRQKLAEFEAVFWHGFEQSVRRVQFLLDEHRKATGGDRRTFAIERAPAIHAGRRAILFSCWDGKQTVRDALLTTVRKNLGSQTKVDGIRWIFGELTFWQYGDKDA